MIKCSECKNKIKVTGGIHLANQGWLFATLIGGGLGWICPYCVKKHLKAIEKIQSRYF